MKNESIAILCAVTCGLFSSFQSAHAASSEWVASGDSRIRLVIAEPQHGAAELFGVLEVDLAKGWKTYWRDPGEAGVPLQIDVATSQNAALSAVQYPAPKRFDDGVTVWAGYDQSVRFPVTLSRSDVSGESLVKANVFLGICEKICVPVQAFLDVKVANATASTADQMLVEQAFANLPQPASTADQISKVETVGNYLDIETTMDSDAAQALFLAPRSGWQFAAPTILSTEGNIVRFKSEILFRPKTMNASAIKIDYTMVGATRNISGTAEYLVP